MPTGEVFHPLLKCGDVGQTELMLEVMSRTVPAMEGSVRSRSSTFRMELRTVV